MDLTRVAAELLRVRGTVEPLDPAVDVTALSEAESYDVQQLVVAALGPVAGYKVGCTSRAVQTAFGLSTPVSGRVLAHQVHESGAVLDAAELVDLAVEPELVLRIGRDLSGAGLSDAELRAGIESVGAGVELHHYRFHHGSPTSQELVAGNALQAGAVLSPESVPLGDLDLDREGIGLFVDGELVESGIGAEILGGPLRSLRWLVTHLTSRGEVLPAGSFVIPGSATSLIRVGAGQAVEARFTRVGTCSVSFS